MVSPRLALVALAIGLQLAVLAPIQLLAGNTAGFQVVYADVLRWPLAIAIVASFLLAAVIQRLMARSGPRPLALLAAFGIYLYLQFYILVPDFGLFDGRVISAFDHPGMVAAEIALLAALFAFAWRRADEAARLLPAGLLMLAALEAVTVAQTAFANKPPIPEGIEATDKDLTSPFFNRTSLKRMLGTSEHSKKNAILIVLDTFQSDILEEMLKDNPDIASAFTGFTFYKNASGHFPFTHFSVAAMLSGSVYNGEETIAAYEKRAYADGLSKRFDALGYHVDLLPLGSRFDFVSGGRQVCRDLTGLYDLAAFRQLPTLLKPWQYNQGEFHLGAICGAFPSSQTGIELPVMQRLIDTAKVTRGDKPSYKFMHFYGLHPPARRGTDCLELKEPDDRPEALIPQGRCILAKTADYLRKLKELGVYDTSAIFVVADHGTRHGLGFKTIEGPAVPSQVISAAHPMILFKDIGATGAIMTSEAPATIADIYATLLSAAGAPASGPETVDMRTLTETQERDRRFLYYFSAKDVRETELPRSYPFKVASKVRDPSGWALAQPPGSKPIQLVDPWLKQQPVKIAAALPDADTTRFAMRLSNSIAGQRIRLALNGREIASWMPETGVSKLEHEVEIAPGERGTTGLFEVGFEPPQGTPSDATLARIDMIHIGTGEASIALPGEPTSGSTAAAEANGTRTPGTLHINPRDKVDAKTYLVKGWSFWEKQHRWTEGDSAEIFTDLETAPERDATLRVKAFGFIGREMLKSQRVTVRVNGEEVAKWEVTKDGWYTATIPAALMASKSLAIAFQLHDARSPQPGKRKVAMAVREIEIVF